MSEPMKLWGGRFAVGPSELFDRFSRSLHFDRKLIRADVRGSKAFANALLRIGILNDDEYRHIFAALQRIETESNDEHFFAGASDEDVHTLVIRKLHEYAGVAAEKIHTGRSRNEQVSLDTRLWLREEIDATRHHVANLIEALLNLGERYPDAVIPGFTHLRRAQAVLWPHYLLAYADMLERDWQRLTEARSRVNVMPLGSGALAGSGFPLTGSRSPANSSSKPPPPTAWTFPGPRFRPRLSLRRQHHRPAPLSPRGRLILYSSDEFGWLELSDPVTSGSSLMPQKKNPDSPELIRGKTGARLRQFLRAIRADEGPADDLQPRHAGRQRAVVRRRRDCAAPRSLWPLEAARGVASPAGSRGGRGGRLAGGYRLGRGSRAEGFPSIPLTSWSGCLVLHSRDRKKPGDWTPETLAAFAPEFRPEHATLLDPREGMKTREAKGGTGPAAVRTALANARARLASMRERTPVW